MNAPSKDIASMLEDVSSLALTFGTDLFVGKRPAEPKNGVTVFDTPGYSPELLLSGGADFNKPSVQIQIQNTSYVSAYELAEAIQNELHGKNNVVEDGTTYCQIKMSGSIFVLDYGEEDNLPRLSMTFDIQRHS